MALESVLDAKNRHLQSHLSCGLLRAAHEGRARLQGHRQADAQHPDARRPRRALPRHGHASTTTSRCCRCRRRRSKSSRVPPTPSIWRGRRTTGWRSSCSSYPGSVSRRSSPSLPLDDPDAAARELHRAVDDLGARGFPDLLQHPRQADLGAGVPAAVRGDGGLRPADLDASVPRRRHARLQDGGSVGVRDLVDVRLAVRDERGDGAARVRRLLRSFSGAEDHHPSHGRDGAVLRRARRPGLGSARRAHVRRGLLGACSSRSRSGRSTTSRCSTPTRRSSAPTTRRCAA